MLEFAWPWFFYLLPLPLIMRLIPRAQRQEVALRTPQFQTMAALASAPEALRRRLGWHLLIVLTWCALVIAGSQPRWVGDPISLPSTGRDLLLAVDISGSMGTEDMTLGGSAVTRLAAVKHVVGDFVERRRGDRLGLILFGSQAYLQAPLTFDRKANQPNINANKPGAAKTIKQLNQNISKPSQNQGNSVQFKKTIKSGRTGSP